MIPLNHVRRKLHKSQEKIDQLLSMDEIKLFIKNEEKNYKYLRLLEADTIKQLEMKERN